MEDSHNNLINLCKKGDRKAQTQLYAVFYKKVYNSCYRMLQSQYEAEDAMQESFIKAFSRLDKYDGETPFEAWILRIAINTAIDKLRENQPEWVDYDEKHFHYPEAEDETEAWELTLEKTQQIKAAIEQLPDTARIIINLYLIEGYDHEEISGILHISAGNARIQYMRAKQKLIEMLK
ncbi:RNA polymerase sigma factor [Bacteroidia bacterium]|nr:RNA polymerase sigma factor [Bacteroidia bacterium]